MPVSEIRFQILIKGIIFQINMKSQVCKLLFVSITIVRLKKDFVLGIDLIGMDVIHEIRFIEKYSIPYLILDWPQLLK